MLLDHDVNLGIAACRANWGMPPRRVALVTGLLAAGMSLIFVESAALLPALSHPTWHRYQRLVA